MARKNKVTRVSLMGGLIGMLTTNPRKALEDEIDQQNQNGWTATHIDPTAQPTCLFGFFNWQCFS